MPIPSTSDAQKLLQQQQRRELNQIDERLDVTKWKPLGDLPLMLVPFTLLLQMGDRYRMERVLQRTFTALESVDPRTMLDEDGLGAWEKVSTAKTLDMPRRAKQFFASS